MKIAIAIQNEVYSHFWGTSNPKHHVVGEFYTSYIPYYIYIVYGIHTNMGY